MICLPAVANRRARYEDGVCARKKSGAGAMALFGSIFLFWSGCSATPEAPPPSVRMAVNPTVVGIVDKSIRIAIQNPNDEAVRVRATIDPAVPRATYRSSGVAVPNAPTTGFALANERTETLAIGGLKNGSSYRVTIETISLASGLPHADVWNERISLVKPRSFRLQVESGAAWSSAPAVDAEGNLILSGDIILSWTNPDSATQISIGDLPRGAVAHTRTLTHNPGAQNNIRISGLLKTKTYTFRVTAENYFGSVTARLTTSAPVPLPIVLWQAAENVSGSDAVARPNLCQETLDAGQSNVAARLHALGYRKAIFFGSSLDYDYRDLATDPDAFGDARGTVVIAANASGFVSPAPVDGRRLVIDDFVREIRYGLGQIATSTPPIAIAVAFVVSGALDNSKQVTEFWTFSSIGDGRYNAEKFGIGQLLTFSSDHDNYIAISAGSAWHGFHAPVLCLSR